MRAMMRYTVKADQMQTHLGLLHDVFNEMNATEPDGLAWTVYKVADSRTFIEYVEGPDLPQPLPLLESFQRYRAGLDERCEEPREFLELELVNSYM